MMFRADASQKGLRPIDVAYDAGTQMAFGSSTGH